LKNLLQKIYIFCSRGGKGGVRAPGWQYNDVILGAEVSANVRLWHGYGE